MNKQFISLILLLSGVTSSYTQTVSNNPFQLYWERYVIEFEQDFISKNQIKNIEAKTVKYKNGKVKNERNKYMLEFNEEYLPVKYTYYLDFGLRNGLRYNPFWRRKNEYPVYNIWEYTLHYDKKNKLKTIVEKKSTTNFEFVFYRKIDFEYDSQERVILQRRSDVILNKFSTKDTLFEISTDSIEVQYETNEKGIILLNTEWSKGDTLFWTKHPFPMALFSFGEKEAVYLRTVPMERNTTLFYATDTTAVISRNADGLMIKKEQNFENSKDEYVKTKPSVTYIYSYVFREDRE